MESKSILSSKTFWFNAAFAILLMAEAKDIINVLPDVARAYVPAIVAGVNILLRVSTTQPVFLPGRLGGYQA